MCGWRRVEGICGMHALGLYSKKSVKIVDQARRVDVVSSVLN
jgi:hypothetical protein